MAQDLRTVLRTGLKALLRPAVLFAISRSFRIQDLLELVKSLYLELAESELRRRGVDPSVSRLSAMTGIHRRDVMRLWRDEAEPKRDTDVITRIIGQWQFDGRFRTKSGRPRTLSFERRTGDFAELVASVSSDLNPYTILFELERAGAVEKTDRGVKLVANVYRPSPDFGVGFSLLGDDAIDLSKAVTENVVDQPDPANLHIKTHYDNIPPKHRDQIRNWFLVHGRAFHDAAREYLSRFDRDITRAPDDGSGRLRAAVGTYSLTEKLDDEPEGEEGEGE